MDDLFAVVGLGNPGPAYAGTRHNLGYRVVELLAERWGAALTGGRGDYLVATATYGGRRVILAKPTTWMNESGFAVQGLVSYYRVGIERLLVVIDDVNLSLGCLRLRGGGSDGGHRGLEHVIYQLGRDDFPRLRIGIGGEDLPGDLRAYVLAPFRTEEKPIAEAAVVKAAEAAETWLDEGIDEAMNRFN